MTSTAAAGFGTLLAVILAPIAAMIIQLAVSRGREYRADSSGASLTHDPEGLASALETLGAYSQRQASLLGRFGRRRAPQPAPQPGVRPPLDRQPAGGLEVGSLFSTHPPIAQRVARLRAMGPR